MRHRAVAYLALVTQLLLARPALAQTPDAELAKTSIAQIYDRTDKMPDAKKLAIYDAAVNIYIGEVKAKYPALGSEYTFFFLPTARNAGFPIGYREYLDLIDDLNEHPGRNPSAISAYGLVREIGIQHHNDLKEDPNSIVSENGYPRP